MNTNVSKMAPQAKKKISSKSGFQHGVTSKQAVSVSGNLR